MFLAFVYLHCITFNFFFFISFLTCKTAWRFKCNTQRGTPQSIMFKLEIILLRFCVTCIFYSDKNSNRINRLGVKTVFNIRHLMAM